MAKPEHSHTESLHDIIYQSERSSEETPSSVMKGCTFKTLIVSEE